MASMLEIHTQMTSTEGAAFLGAPLSCMEQNISYSSIRGITRKGIILAHDMSFMVTTAEKKGYHLGSLAHQITRYDLYRSAQ